MISDKKLNKLKEEFCTPREEFGGKNYITRRREWFDKPIENIRPLLLENKIDHLTIEDAKKIYNEMSVGGPKLYPITYIENGLEQIKKSLKYLLYDKDELSQRFYNFAGNQESEYRLNGVGKAFASTALFLLDHKKYCIWNNAVDGGLELLGLLPPKERGQNIGQAYLKILKILIDLQNKCDFEDLSVLDEFVELIFHGKIGGKIIKQPEESGDEENIQELILPNKKADNDIHLKYQYHIARMGELIGNDVWIASNDKNKIYEGESLNTISLAELPHFAGPTVLNIAKSIDIIWFKKNTAQPICFFEIEHSTSIYSGLLRLNDVKIDYPIPQAFIVAHKDRRKQFENQIERRTFSYSELSEVCQFMTYEEADKFIESYEAIKIIHKKIKGL